jgi:ATP-dependent Lon protease
MTELDKKINEHFPGLVVRKDLVKIVKGNAVVPSYVLEYLLGQYCATSDENSIASGIETVKQILRKHYVHRNEATWVKSKIKEKGYHKIIDKISVKLNDKNDSYEAYFSNLGLKKVLVDSHTVKQHPKLLVNGVWCIVDMKYEFTENRNVSSWIMTSLKPIQLSRLNFSEYLEKREYFSTESWIDLLIQSIGLNPQMFSKRSKFLQLTRLIPYCERNYNLIELGPKGTGKSHIYSEFSPHGILISGGEVTVPKLFVNNSTGKIGLVGYWDTIAFDEIAGREKKVNNALVDILKNYMANKTFSRGIETLGAEASMVFVGNTQHNLPFMLKHTNLFSELPKKYYDSAFLDRLHMYLPGWEVDIIRGEMFTDGYGFVVDYLAEVLKNLREIDFSHLYEEHFTLFNEISTRDRDGINKTFSGLMKILYPSGKATKEEIRYLLDFAIEGRKRIKTQLLKIDSTYNPVKFGYTDNNGKSYIVKCLEEKEYPQYFDEELPENDNDKEKTIVKKNLDKKSLKEDHLVYHENQRGVTYAKLFGPYLKGAKKVIITDPYIRKYYQFKNLMEFLETIIKLKENDEEVEVKLFTTEDEFDSERQRDYLAQIKEIMPAAGINFEWEFENSKKMHARHIIINDSWKISLDRGLDIFQRYDYKNAFSLPNKLQEQRSCMAFEVTYIKL